MVTIPKRIYQTWKTTIVPEVWKEAQNSVRSMNPDYEYVFLTDADNRKIIEQHFPDFLQVYDEFPYNIQRADAVRYAILYLWGGIYLDLDFVSIRPFSELQLDSPIGLVDTPSFGKTTTNSFLVSAPLQSFWLKCIDEMKKPVPWWVKWSPGLTVLHSTGPNMLHRVYRRCGGGAVQKLTDIIVPCDVCKLYYGSGVCQGRTPYFLLPVEGRSWNGTDMDVMNFLYCYRFIIVLGIVFSMVMWKKSSCT